MIWSWRSELDVQGVISWWKKQKVSGEKTQKVPDVQLSLAAILTLNKSVNWEMKVGELPGIRPARGLMLC